MHDISLSTAICVQAKHTLRYICKQLLAIYQLPDEGVWHWQVGSHQRQVASFNQFFSVLNVKGKILCLEGGSAEIQTLFGFVNPYKKFEAPLLKMFLPYVVLYTGNCRTITI